MISLTFDDIEKVIVGEHFYLVPDTLMTVCVLTLANGFNVIGESACAHKSVFDAEVGKAIAKEKAKSKVWPLEGYLLKQKLYEENC